MRLSDEELSKMLGANPDIAVDSPQAQPVIVPTKRGEPEHLMQVARVAELEQQLAGARLTPAIRQTIAIALCQAWTDVAFDGKEYHAIDAALAWLEAQPDVPEPPTKEHDDGQ